MAMPPARIRKLKFRYDAAFAKYQKCKAALSKAAVQVPVSKRLMELEARALEELVRARAELIAGMGEATADIISHAASRIGRRSSYRRRMQIAD